MFVASKRAFTAVRDFGVKKVFTPLVAVRNSSTSPEIQVEMGDVYATHSKFRF